MAAANNVLSATELAFARNPSITWFDDPDAYTLGPEEGSTGLNIGLGIVNAVSVYLQICPGVYNTGKSSFHTISRSGPGFDSAGTYTITTTGPTALLTNHTTTGQLTIDLAVRELVDAINTSTFNSLDGGLAYAMAGSGDGVIDTVRVFMPDDTFVVNAAVSGGSLTSVADNFPSYVDAATVSAKVWAKFTSPIGVPITMPWGMVANGDLGSLPPEGYIERLNAAGFERLYVELHTITKDAGDGADMVARPFLAIAPAIPEE